MNLKRLALAQKEKAGTLVPLGGEEWKGVMFSKKESSHSVYNLSDQLTGQTSSWQGYAQMGKTISWLELVSYAYFLSSV